MGDDEAGEHHRVGRGEFFDDPSRALSLLEQGRSVAVMQGYTPLAIVRPPTAGEREYYARVAERSRRDRVVSEELLNRLADRIPAAQLEGYRRAHSAGEARIWASNLAAILDRSPFPVTSAELELISEFLGHHACAPGQDPYLGRVPEILAALNGICRP